jgi:hypothetical protein
LFGLGWPSASPKSVPCRLVEKNIRVGSYMLTVESETPIQYI